MKSERGHQVSAPSGFTSRLLYSPAVLSGAPKLWGQLRAVVFLKGRYVLCEGEEL